MERVNRWKTYTDEQLEEVEKSAAAIRAVWMPERQREKASVLQLIWRKKPDTKILRNM